MLTKIKSSRHRALSRPPMPVLPQSSSPVQANALDQRLEHQRKSFWHSFKAARNYVPLTQATVHRPILSRSLRAGLEALRSDRNQELSHLLNA